MLRAIVERDPAAVFPLVDRLLEAGADLTEFVNGAGETLRALLLVGVGGQPEGLTEGLTAVVREYAPQLPPADVVRLLTILSDSEERLSRSANQRLLVEVLLLRWAMLDRTVEIGEVLEALKGSTAGRPDGRTNPSPTPLPTPTASDRPAVGPSDRPTGKKLEPTLDNVRAIWSQIVQDARAKTPLLGSLLAEAQVVAVEGRIVTLRPGHAVHAEGLERQRETIAQALGQYISEAPRVAVVAGGATAERITPAGASAERLKSLRAKDPTLSAAVDALDLELLE
jgi:DNA polymerase-3 subunit gamma/tau